MKASNGFVITVTFLIFNFIYLPPLFAEDGPLFLEDPWPPYTCPERVYTDETNMHF